MIYEKRSKSQIRRIEASLTIHLYINNIIRNTAIGWAAFFACTGSICNVGMSAVDEDQSLVRAQIESLWGVLDSFECRSIEKIEMQSDMHNSNTTIDFSWRIDGRSALSWTRERPAETTCFDVREDGTRRVTVQYFKTRPKAIDRILIDRTLNNPGHYGGLGFAGLRLFLPGGRTIAAILNSGGILVNSGTSRNPRWILTAKLDGDEYECVLDETHQFSPKELTINTEASRQIARVDRFEQADGFWYPAEGSRTFISHKDHSQVKLTFLLERVAINRSIANAKFEWRDFPTGVAVTNQLDHSMKLVGGKLARLKLQSEHPLPMQKAPTNEPVQVPDDANALTRRLAMIVSIGIAILTGGLGVYFRRRGF
jgi:hypothetical protein